MCGIGTYRARNRTHHCSIPSTQQSSIKSVCKSGDTLFGKLRPYLRKYAFVKKDMVCSSEIWSNSTHGICSPDRGSYFSLRLLASTANGYGVVSHEQMLPCLSNATESTPLLYFLRASTKVRWYSIRLFKQLKKDAILSCSSLHGKSNVAAFKASNERTT